MENELMQQTIILTEILLTLKLILREMRDGVDIDEDFYNNLFNVFDKTADVIISFLELLKETNQISD